MAELRLALEDPAQVDHHGRNPWWGQALPARELPAVRKLLCRCAPAPACCMPHWKERHEKEPAVTPGLATPARSGGTLSAWDGGAELDDGTKLVDRMRYADDDHDTTKIEIEHGRFAPWWLLLSKHDSILHK